MSVRWMQGIYDIPEKHSGTATWEMIFCWEAQRGVGGASTLCIAEVSMSQEGARPDYVIGRVMCTVRPELSNVTRNEDMCDEE